MKAKERHKIANAYDAWWFLHSHPRLMLRERTPVGLWEAEIMKAQGYLVTTDKNGQNWREWRHLHRHAVEENLGIHYAKVDCTGNVNEDDRVNVNVGCWLELGRMEWRYPSEWHKATSLLNFHDVCLDCSGKTFDEALVKLARKVRRLYGDYREGKRREGPCGKPCADCEELKTFKRKRMKGIKENDMAKGRQ